MAKRTTGGKSLYDQNPKTWESIGFRTPHIMEVAKRFSVPAFMDRALGTKNAVARWNNGLTVPKYAKETTAMQWLNTHPVETVDFYEVNARKSWTRKSTRGPSVKSNDDHMVALVVVIPVKNALALRSLVKAMGGQAEDM